MGDSLLFLQWQTSLAMAEGDAFTSDVVTAAGLLLTCAMALKQTAGVVACTFAAFREMRWWDTAGCVAISVLAGSGTSLMLLRITMIYYCPAHRWGISTGCT